ncbi:MAG: Fe-S cluster assembly protein SufD, partial [Proteobacteria bacterium]|nr:Fe-S cluster assembly protein SufD [Burkholderiales bacterium]
ARAPQPTHTPAKVRAHLGVHARFETSFFSALNTARLSDGAVVVCARGANAATPVHLLFLSSARPAPFVVQPRVIVVAEAGSEVTVVEEYASLGESTVFTNSVTEIVVEADALVRHVRLQRENRASFHVGRCAVSLARAARYRSASVNLGARLSRLDLEVTLDGEGAEAHLDGLALIDARQHSDTHSLLDHAQPHGLSRQLHKCVCDGGSHAVFNGRILVRRNAQRTDSAQQIRALLLSPNAQINAKPQLEIFADDVKAAHGATVGQLDGDELFYLASRGLPLERARKLLTYAFAAEVIERIPVRSLVGRLGAVVMARTGLQ